MAAENVSVQDDTKSTTDLTDGLHDAAAIVTS